MLAVDAQDGREGLFSHVLQGSAFENKRLAAVDDGGDDVSSLSSVPSMGRQMTELSEAQCTDIMERQLSSFQSRGSEFWRRQCTAPTGQQKEAFADAFSRQMSCPIRNCPDLRSRGFSTLAPIQAIHDDNSDCCSQTPFGSRGATQEEETDELDEGLLENAISVVVSECSTSVSVADPGGLDSELIAVSDGFVQMTGFDREEVVGENCRFMNEHCPPMPESQRKRLARACETGQPFTAVLVNRRKSGELFFNLLDLRGLILARSACGLEDLWILIACQADVTHLDRNELPSGHAELMRQVGSRIRKRLLKQLAELGLAGAMFKYARASESPEDGAPSTKDSWWLAQDVMWRIGKPEPAAVRRSLDDLPDFQALPLLAGERLRGPPADPRLCGAPLSLVPEVPEAALNGAIKPEGGSEVAEEAESGQVQPSLAPSTTPQQAEAALGLEPAQPPAADGGAVPAEGSAGKPRVATPMAAAACAATALLVLLSIRRLARK